MNSVLHFDSFELIEHLFCSLLCSVLFSCHAFISHTCFSVTSCLLILFFSLFVLSASVLFYRHLCCLHVSDLQSLTNLLSTCCCCCRCPLFHSPFIDRLRQMTAHTQSSDVQGFFLLAFILSLLQN